MDVQKVYSICLYPRAKGLNFFFLGGGGYFFHFSWYILTVSDAPPHVSQMKVWFGCLLQDTLIEIVRGKLAASKVKWAWSNRTDFEDVTAKCFHTEMRVLSALVFEQIPLCRVDLAFPCHTAPSDLQSYIDFFVFLSLSFRIMGRDSKVLENFKDEDEAICHLLLFVSALIPKAFASFLTSFVIELSRDVSGHNKSFQGSFLELFFNVLMDVCLILGSSFSLFFFFCCCCCCCCCCCWISLLLRGPFVLLFWLFA